MPECDADEMEIPFHLSKSTTRFVVGRVEDVVHQAGFHPGVVRIGISGQPYKHGCRVTW